MDAATPSLLALALSSFTSATFLPGTSEVVLLAVLHGHPDQFWIAIAVATVGNTLGALTSFAIGRLVPNRVAWAGVQRVRRYGYPVLLLSWVPVLGDALVAAAGWLRLDPLRAALLLALGKLARYVVLAQAWQWFAGT